VLSYAKILSGAMLSYAKILSGAMLSYAKILSGAMLSCAKLCDLNKIYIILNKTCILLYE
jgi:hypothetical protein